MFRIARALLFASFLALPGLSALAAGYPEKPIRLLIPFAPGGGTDLLCRAIQPRLEKALGTGVIIDNRAGAGGTIGVTLAAKAPPDGYTFLVTSASFTFAPGLYKKDLPYDAIKDFKPITMLTQQSIILAVHPSMPVKNVKELIALAKKRPKEIFHAHAGVGSNLYMTTELFKNMSKISMTGVAYKGGGPSLIALITGEVQVSFVSILGSKPFRKSGQVRAIAVSTKERSPAVPDLPTINESGVPGFDKGGWFGMFAQAQVPEPIIAYVYQAMAKVLKDPEATKRLADDGLFAVASTPKDFTAFIHAEIQEWNKVIQEMKL
jgi:tripartite-type tricarboxylate transporter receptor subunit TctC